MLDSWLCPLDISYQVTQEWDQEGWGTPGQIHGGIDVAPTAGGNPPIYPARAGIVTTVTSHSQGGNYVIVQHDDGYWTYYGHFRSVRVTVGEKVNANSILGIMGKTGLATGVHLHFEVWQGAQWQRVNPRSVINFDGKGRTNNSGNPQGGNSNEDKKEKGDLKMFIAQCSGGDVNQYIKNGTFVLFNLSRGIYSVLNGQGQVDAVTEGHQMSNGTALTKTIMNNVVITNLINGSKLDYRG
ncbi:M23 family metallopeptidase [Lactococcus carnosus]|uniref:M23 family metallopeptidase n=1 Tax=Pseudolactococcus carnosus TaxID=2749961 RepID=UPI001FB904E6|nr:M23 family metallopeptidase [Lactococcus carnosus]MCJ2003310.1 M23 family metallopeptidase [Lactococcus carnosus]